MKIISVPVNGIGPGLESRALEFPLEIVFYGDPTTVILFKL